VLHCDANCLCLCRPTVFWRNVFFELIVVAQASVAQKIIRPNVFRPAGFSPNRLHAQARKFTCPLAFSHRTRAVLSQGSHVPSVKSYFRDSDYSRGVSNLLCPAMSAGAVFSYTAPRPLILQLPAGTYH